MKLCYPSGMAVKLDDVLEIGSDKYSVVDVPKERGELIEIRCFESEDMLMVGDSFKLFPIIFHLKWVSEKVE